MDNMVLRLENMSKVFPGVKALHDVTIEARGGEVTALIGVNGAGKSTLMNILGGVHRASAGKIYINGEEVKIHSPQDAEQHGIGFIHQEPITFNFMTVAENICISKLKKGVHYKKMNDAAQRYLRMMDCDIKSTAKVGDLPIGERQMVEIARALSCVGKILLFDEPTASFTTAEKKKLFEIIRELKARGAVIFFISHFLDEVEEISDRTIVLRDGQVVISGLTKDIPRSEILMNMIGGEVVKLDKRTGKDADDVVFQAEAITSGKAPVDVSFRLRKGEIVGLWGLMGSGRTELVQTLYGLKKADKGKVYIDTGNGLRHVSFKNVREYCGYVTEERHDDGLFLPWPVWKNITSPHLKAYRGKPLPFLDFKRQREDAEEYVQKLNVKTPDVQTKIESLSGGNMQKVIMAKWLLRKPRIFLLDEPTRGVDVGAKAEIHKMIQNLAQEGTACLLISSEIEEIYALSDRVLVLNRGHIAAEIDKADIDKEILMSYCV
ncbi:MAG: sugar ABC transporter ATP-binding protein [Clostridia bacterium]|nr:sugar ABC transporter ATP-binding protein [Clostridia bacterium]